MRLLWVCVLGVVGLVSGMPRSGRDGEGADVVKLTDSIAPILLSPEDEGENVILRDASNGTNVVVVPSSSPAPVPDSVPVTTSKPAENTPNLVPQVVDISTPDPNATPAPGNVTSSTVAPEEEDDDSEEDGESEEADEENEDEDDDEEEDDEEEDEENDDEDEEEDDAKKKKKSDAKKRKQRDVKPVKKVVNESDDDVDEVDGVVSIGKKVIKKPTAPVGVSKLQGVPARGPTGEDDEDEGGVKV